MRVIDIGVRGGFGEHWLHFGDHLEVWGFDPQGEHGVDPLIKANPHPDRWHYFKMALGDLDGARPFNFLTDNPSSSHFAASNGSGDPDVIAKWPLVQMRRLDSLMEDGVIGQIDFIKMDAETYEIEIIKGADRFLQSSGVFGIESETSFWRTMRNPRSHFVELYGLLGDHGFSVYDGEAERGAQQRPTVYDFLFLHDDFEKNAPLCGVDRILKMISVAEIHCLQSMGLDLLIANRQMLASRLDPDEAAEWLNAS